MSEERPVVVLPTDPTIIEPTSSTAENISVEPEVVGNNKLPPVDYPPGSVGQACEVNKFPSRVKYYDTPWEKRVIGPVEKDPFFAINDEKCYTALERHIYSINPYHWGIKDEKQINRNRLFSFVVIDNPLTFERIFTDPAGDFARVQEAFANPECQLGQHDESNWNLNETCHTDAILNYALLTRFCDENVSPNGVSERTRTYYKQKDNPTPEQDRSMWIQSLEDQWVRRKCKAVYPPSDHQHTELRKQIWALQEEKGLIDEILINLAAKLGDSAAGLTQPFTPPGGPIYQEEGYKYGPHTEWFTNVFEPNDLFTKRAPNVDRLRNLVLLFAKNIAPNHGVFIKFDHEALVRHFCTPPYYDTFNDDSLIAPDPPSCREVINELRQEALPSPWLEVIATFEDVAMRLEVYE